MALGSHLITVRRLKKYIDDVIGKKANLPDTSKTIIGNISQINSNLSNKQNKAWNSITAPALGASNITIPSTANELVFSIYDDADKFALTIPVPKMALPLGSGVNFGNGGYCDASLSAWGQVYTDGNICRISSAFLNGDNITSRCQLTLFYR